MADHAGDGTRTSELPELVYEIPPSQPVRIDGLKLVADSVAQMRQAAASRIIGSPLVLALLAAVPLLTYAVVYKSTADIFTILMTSVSATMSILVAIRGFLRGYIDQAEAIDWKWLGDDHMMVARYGSEVIGTVIYHLRDSAETEPGHSGPGSPSKGQRRGKAPRTSNCKAEIRAWTIRRRQRGHGVGTALLESVVQRCLKAHKCTHVELADAAHGRAGAKEVLSPRMARFTTVQSMLDDNERRVQRILRRVVEEAQA